MLWGDENDLPMSPLPRSPIRSRSPIRYGSPNLRKNVPKNDQKPFGINIYKANDDSSAPIGVNSIKETN